jgi:hypothetical protein
VLAYLDVGARLREPLGQLRGHALLVEVRVLLAPRAHPRLARELRVGRVVGGRREVQRHPHDRRLDHRAGRDRGLEVGAREVLQPRREREIGRRRVLGLQRGQAPDRLRGVEPVALDQALARGERGGQLLAREGPHAAQPRRGRP